MALNYTKGTISYMSEVTSGVSNSGKEWARMNIMIDIPGYQGSITKLSLQVGMDRINDVLEFQVGDKVEIGWSIYAREWNGKWYNNVDLVTIKADGQTAAPAQTAPQAKPLQVSGKDLDPQDTDLPF